jgi:tetratricopeptide (TPR) repeat protein
MHAEAMLGRIAAADGRLDEAAARLGRAAAVSAELGFAGQTALHLTHVGDVEQQADDHVRAIATLEQAMAAARAAGDGRIAATIRLRLARSLVHLGRDAEAVSALQENLNWYVHAGGGEGQRDSEVLLATIAARSTDR